MRNWIVLLLSFTLIPCSAGADAVDKCRSVPGLNDLLDGQQIRFLIVGETHGTNETPALIGDLACNIAMVRPVTVALEFDSAATPALNSYLQSDGGDEAKRALLRSAIWDRSIADGRSSKAMFGLVDRLRQLRKGGAKIRIAAFQPNDLRNLDQYYYELAMASDWAKIADSAPDSLNLILVGEIHASKERDGGYPFAPAASHLKSMDTWSLRAEPEGGTAWNCQEDGCRVHALSGRAAKGPYITRFPVERGGFNGIYSVGRPYSASEPVRAK